MNPCKWLLLSLLLVGWHTGCANLHAASEARIVDLRCEYVKNPLGVDTTEPHLSWRMESTVPGQVQTAYQILVASSSDHLSRDNGDLWDSGKVTSDQSIQVEYAGADLCSNQTCYWKVRVWDKGGKATDWSEAAQWVMGLLKSEDWKAQWIGSPNLSTVAPASVSKPITKQSKGAVTVKQATYQTLDGSITVDVTAILQKELAKKKPFKVDFKILGGDPAPGSVKELVVKYERDGKPGIARAKDFQPLGLFGTASPAKPKKPSGVALPAPLFRKEFELSIAPESARMTVHSQAYHELYVNGKKVGHHVLTPAVFDNKQNGNSFSVTYEVSRYLKAGKNCIGLWFGSGWAKTIAVRAQLDAVVKGRPLTIPTDTTWQVHTSGRYKTGGQKWNNYGGELVDARELIPDWSEPNIDTTDWRSAVSAKGLIAPVRTQSCPLNRLGKTIPAVSVNTIAEGVYEIDFGTNLTGWFRMVMPALKSGTEVTMTFADAKRDTRKQAFSELAQGAWYQHFNQVSTYISAGKPGDIFQHKFNYAGFRYVIVKGLPTPPAVKDATGFLVESDLESAGGFESSNKLLNRIHEVNTWTQRCLNLGGYYIDCPTRERWGYGDGQVAVEGFMTNFRADGFYRKWLGNWRHCLIPPRGAEVAAVPAGGAYSLPSPGVIISITVMSVCFRKTTTRLNATWIISKGSVRKTTIS
jgi:hypothetical protein